MIKRRDFLITCAVSTTALMTPLGLVAAENKAVDNTGNRFSKEIYESLLHHSFRCMSEEREMIKMELVEVRDGPQMPGIEQFSLTFQGSLNSGAGHMQTGLYQLYHHKTGHTLLHLTPSDSQSGHYTTYLGLFT